MEAAAHRRQFGLTGTLPGNRLGKTEAFSPSCSVAELAGSPGKPAASVPGPQSAFCRLHRGFFSRVLFLLHHAGWGKLETFPEHEEKKKILTRTPPPIPFVWTLSLEGPSRGARREIIIFGLGYCYFFFGSHCCDYCQETGGELWGGGRGLSSTNS